MICFGKYYYSLKTQKNGNYCKTMILKNIGRKSAGEESDST